MTKRSRLVMAVLAMVTVAGLEAAAQEVMSNSELRARAIEAGRSNDWIRAYGFLMALIQRDPPEMVDPGYRDQALEALNAAYSNAYAALRATSDSASNSGTPGVGVKSSGLTSQEPFNPPSKSTHPRAYRLECRGGGEMHANYYPHGETVYMEVHFLKAQAAAQVALPGQGECAWMDRPIGEAEPYWLEWRFSSSEQRIDRIMFGSRDGVPGIGLEPSNSENPPGLIMEVDGRQLGTLIGAIRNGDRFAVECYNNGKGKFIVTRLFF